MRDLGDGGCECAAADGWDGIAAALARAGDGPPGARVLLAAGDYRGGTPLAVPAGVTLEGQAGARLIWGGAGSAVCLSGVAGAGVLGLEIEVAVGLHTGRAPGRGHALIRAVDCTGVRIADCTLGGGGDHLYGLLIRRCESVTVAGCRVLGCGSGILIWSSTEVVATGNQCGGNRGPGIQASREPDRPGRPCECRLIGNRCHDNQGSGILFASSQGRAEGNECWGNGKHGIGLQRDPRWPQYPPNAALIGNRCHDNQEAGICLYSSQGRAEGNECWGNGMHGIVLQRDSDAPQDPSDAAVIGNRCHDNQGTGICFFSSQGRAEGNDCWGNGKHGIALQRGPNAPQDPSDAALIGNRCDHNRRFGIRFGSSNSPRCADNHCWDNLGGDAIVRDRQEQDEATPRRRLLPECSVEIESHFTTRPEPTVLAASRRGARADRALVETLEGLGAVRPEALADFLGSACADCFSRYWFGPALVPAAAAATPASEAQGEAQAGPPPLDQALVYHLHRVAQGEVDLRRSRPGAPRAAVGRRPAGLPPESVPRAAPLSPFFTAFVQTWLKGRDLGWPAVAADGHAGPPGLAWNLALVAARPAGLDLDLAGLIEQAEERLTDLTLAWAAGRGEPPGQIPRLGAPLLVDLGGRPGEDGDLRRAMEEAMIAGGPGAARWRVLAALPFALSGLLALGPALALLPLWYLGGDGATAALLAAGGPDWAGFGAALGDGWAGLKWIERAAWAGLTVGAPLVWLAALNLLLPRRLHLRLPAVLTRFAHWGVGLLFGVSGPGTGGRFRAWLNRCDAAAGRRWLRRRLFGSALERVDLALVVLRGLASLGAADAAWLESLARLRGPNQGLLVLSRIGDLANLPAAWLPQVSAAAGEVAGWSGPPQWDGVFLVHDPDSAAIGAPEPNGEPTDDTAALGPVLGYGEGECAARAGERRDPIWVVGDLLPALVLGSTAAAPAILTKRLGDEPDQYGSDWAREVYPYQALFDGPGCRYRLRPERVTQLVGHARAALGIAVQDPPERGPGRDWFALVGQAGQRLALAAALGADFARAGAGPGPARRYLARLLAGGEVHHLLRCVESIGGEPFGQPLWSGADPASAVADPPGPDGRRTGRPPARGAELPLHLEAALALLDERLALGAPAPVMDPSGGARSARRAERIASAPVGSAVRTDAPTAQARPDVTIAVAGPAEPASADSPGSASFAVSPGVGGNWAAWGLSATGVTTFGARSPLSQAPAASPTEAQTPPDPNLTATLDLAWQSLGRGLDAPLPTEPWTDPRTGRLDEAARRADATRVYCAWLAGLERMERAADGRITGLPRLADLLADLTAALGAWPAALRDPDQTAAGDWTRPGIRGVFYAEARTMADDLAVREQAPAAVLLDQRLRQDWWRLPEPFKALLRARCLDAGARVPAALAGAADSVALLAVAERYAQRPALVVAALAALALWHRRPQPDAASATAAVAPDGLADLGRFLIGLHRRLGPPLGSVETAGAGPEASAVAAPEPLSALLPPPGLAPAQTGRISALVADADFAGRLAAVLATGEADRRQLRERVADMGRIDLEGLALGPHLPAVRILDEIRLGAEFQLSALPPLR